MLASLECQSQPTRRALLRNHNSPASEPKRSNIGNADAPRFPKWSTRPPDSPLLWPRAYGEACALLKSDNTQPPATQVASQKIEQYKTTPETTAQPGYRREEYSGAGARVTVSWRSSCNWGRRRATKDSNLSYESPRGVRG